ncbi:MAG: hypothetical protein NTY95_14760 [Bacteroidia bacterium]|jgi:hypothetical protein|nr:hypothetical protein [Bacteroidia bacterium]
MKRPIIVLFVMALLGLNPGLKAQNSLEGYLDIGKNQVSKGLYSQISNIGCFEKTKWGIQAGYQFGLVQPQDVIFNSWYMNPYGKIKMGNILLDIGGEYLWTAISQDLRETNWIVSARTTLNHWKLGFGTSFRTYRLSRKAADDAFQFYSENRITEKWNMMYNATYVLKPYENRWNLSASFINYDHFIIQQENNPMFNLRFDYKISTPLSLYSELWYKPAGLMVIRVTYFGMFLRLGVLWKI